ncbi:MAG: winged helix-turn-helix transcriptional regulator [Planctomycetes bacterium]|nr:winged helix-turn-helix transcriptional regulator [Planctomycetota bacterium]
MSDSPVLTKNLIHLRPNRALQMLNILLAVEENPESSQHQLARGISSYPNTVNKLMRALTTGGLVERRGATNRTTSYHVTASGREEKNRLLREVSSEIVRFYGHIRRAIEQRLAAAFAGIAAATGKPVGRVAVHGCAETGEVVLHALARFPVEVAAVFDSDPGKQGARFGGRVVEAPEREREYEFDAVIAASFGQAKAIRERWRPLEQAGVPVITLEE